MFQLQHWAKAPDPDNDLFLLVLGASFPGHLRPGPPQHWEGGDSRPTDPLPPRLTMRPVFPLGSPENRVAAARENERRTSSYSRLWFEQPQPGGAPNLLPRTAMFAVDHECLIGTKAALQAYLNAAIARICEDLCYTHDINGDRTGLPSNLADTPESATNYVLGQEELRRHWERHKDLIGVARLPVVIAPAAMAQFDNERARFPLPESLQPATPEPAPVVAEGRRFVDLT